MGLLHEYSTIDNERSRKPEESVFDQDVPDLEDIFPDAETSQKDTARPQPETLTGRDMFFFGLITVGVFVTILFIFSFVFVFQLVGENPDLLDQPETLEPLLTETLFSAPLTLLLGSMLVSSISFLCAVAFAAFRIQWDWGWFGLRRQRETAAMMRQAVLLGLIGAPLLYGISMIGQTDLAATTETLSGIAPEFGFLLIVVAVLLVPFAEELYFRGVIYRWTRTRLAPWPSIILNAWIYGFLNIAAGNLLVGFISGIGLAYVYEKSRSIWPALLAHGILNLVTVFLILVTAYT